MYYTVYKVTNTLNGKFYIGVHRTLNPYDSYLGSGTQIIRAVAKYGKEAFSKEVLFVFDNPEDMYRKEAEIVTVEFLSMPDTYNITLGGKGSWVGVDGVNRGNQRLRQLLNSSPTFKKQFSQSVTNSNLKGYATGARKRHFPYNWKGKTHTPETKALLTEVRSHAVGEKNSQYGTIWVRKSEFVAKKVKLCDLEAHLAEGWVRGRVEPKPKPVAKTTTARPSPTKGRTWVHLGNQSKMVMFEEIDFHLESGWVLGMSPSTSEVRKTHTGDLSSQKGRFWVVREGFPPRRVVGEEELNRHLKEGWSRGKVLR